jgi:hypothetical protein
MFPIAFDPRLPEFDSKRPGIRRWVGVERALQVKIGR